ncbi:MAG: smalltalk protein [Prevotella sp.]|nr:smalltalk protein [Prevotella sp.]
MNQNSKQTWKRIIDIIITILTALITSITTTSCIGNLS